MFSSKEEKWKRKVHEAMLIKRAVSSRTVDSSENSLKRRIAEMSTRKLLHRTLKKAEAGQPLTDEELQLYKAHEMSTFKIKNWRDLVAFSFALRKHGYTAFRELNYVDLSELDLKTVDSEFFKASDLETNKMEYTGSLPIKINRRGMAVGVCDMCEFYNRSILYKFTETGQFSGPGNLVIIKLQGKTIGYVKRDGNYTLLCSRTVKDVTGKNIFIKNVVYSIDKKMFKFIFRQKPCPTGQPYELNLEAYVDYLKDSGNSNFGISFRHLKFIEDEKIPVALTELTRRSDAGGIPTTEIDFSVKRDLDSD